MGVLFKTSMDQVLCSVCIDLKVILLFEGPGHTCQMEDLIDSFYSFL